MAASYEPVVRHTLRQRKRRLLWLTYALTHLLVWTTCSSSQAGFVAWLSELLMPSTMALSLLAWALGVLPAVSARGISTRAFFVIFAMCCTDCRRSSQGNRADSRHVRARYSHTAIDHDSSCDYGCFGRRLGRCRCTVLMTWLSFAPTKYVCNDPRCVSDCSSGCGHF